MDKITLNCQKREQTGKEIVKKLRKQGIIPAVIYGQDTVCVLQVPVSELKVLRQHNYSESILIDAVVDNGGKKESIPVVLKDVQFHPLNEEVIHLDFLKVSLKDKIRVKVPLAVRGEAPGVKAGGVMEQMLWEVEVESLPTDIPEKIEVDISALDAGHSIHVRDLKVDESKFRVLTHAEDTVLTVLAHGTEEEAEETVEEEGSAEPEVIKEKKEETK